MSKIKKFEIELFNPKTEDIETVTARKFISTGELYNISEKAEVLENPNTKFKETLDTAMDIIIGVFGETKTSDDKKINDSILKERLSSDDFLEVAKNIIMISSGQDPKALPPESQ